MEKRVTDGVCMATFRFDPLSLGSDPELLRWFQQAELVHGRTAMTGVAGILFPAVQPPRLEDLFSFHAPRLQGSAARLNIMRGGGCMAG